MVPLWLQDAETPLNDLLLAFVLFQDMFNNFQDKNWTVTFRNFSDTLDRENLPAVVKVTAKVAKTETGGGVYGGGDKASSGLLDGRKFTDGELTVSCH